MTKPRAPRIEMCVEGVEALLLAQRAGADSVELCAALPQGITPSIGMVREALKLATIPLSVAVRPRCGSFLYSPHEFSAMLRDVEALRDLGVDGVSFGCLAADGHVDTERTRALVRAAKPLAVTFRLEGVADRAEAVEDLVHCGVERVLVPGSDIEATGEIARAADGRLAVIASGLDASAVPALFDRTGIHEAQLTLAGTDDIAAIRAHLVQPA